MNDPINKLFNEMMECKEHCWKIIKRPEKGNSGWYDAECIICGKKTGWDTSD